MTHPKSPKSKSDFTSRVMKSNKPRDTKTEIIVRKELYKRGYRGYRINYKKIPGSPDIAFTKKRVAIFVNGCFWHNCPHCKKDLPKTNYDYWLWKREDNKKRDIIKKQQLEEMDWTVITIWECKIKKSPRKVVDNIVKKLV